MSFLQMYATLETDFEESQASYCKSNLEDEIGEDAPLRMPFEPVVYPAPNEAIWATFPRAEVVARATSQYLCEAPVESVPDLEEEVQEAKKPLGLPPKPLYELLSRTSPEPESLYRLADEIEAERRRLKERNE